MGKSGDKGEAYASEEAFLQKAFSYASSAWFCPLRYGDKSQIQLIYFVIYNGLLSLWLYITR
jgi:hypothetical protein